MAKHGRGSTPTSPVTAVHLMNNDVIPTFETRGAKIETGLSDNGSEFCGRPDHHPYEPDRNVIYEFPMDRASCY